MHGKIQLACTIYGCTMYVFEWKDAFRKGRYNPVICVTSNPWLQIPPRKIFVTSSTPPIHRVGRRSHSTRRIFEWLKIRVFRSCSVQAERPQPCHLRFCENCAKILNGPVGAKAGCWRLQRTDGIDKTKNDGFFQETVYNMLRSGGGGGGMGVGGRRTPWRTLNKSQLSIR